MDGVVCWSDEDTVDVLAEAGEEIWESMRHEGVPNYWLWDQCPIRSDDRIVARFT